MFRRKRHAHAATVGTILALTMGVPALGGQSVVGKGTQDDGARNASLFSAVGAPRDHNRDRLPLELEGRARIVRAETSTVGHVPGAPAGEVTKSTPRGEVVSIPRADTPIIRVISDEAVERSIAATGTPEAAVFYMSNVCVSRFSPAVCVMDDSDGNLEAQRMIFGNGWTPGNGLLAYEAEVFVSGSTSPDDSVTTDLTLELWDADPLEVFDTTCMRGVTAAPYAGTLCTFSDLPEGHTYVLRCDVPTTAIACDRAFAALTVERGCQVQWSVPCVSHPDDPDEMFTRQPDVGDGNGWEVVYACEQDGSCDTANGLNAGVCCEDNSITCDHTDGSQECFQMEHCGDNVADSWFGLYDPVLGYYDYYNFVGAAYAQAQVIMQVVPVSVDAPPPNIPAGVTISGNDVTIDQGMPPAGKIRHLWFELYVSDWDPSHTGLKLKVWQAAIDSSGYQTGILGGLTPWRPACTTTADCVTALGQQGVGALAGGCNMPGMPPNVCMAGWANDARTDFIFAGLAQLGGVDQSTLNYRYGSTLLGLSIASPHIGNMFLGSLTLTTDIACPKGDFQVKMGLPNVNSNMVDQNSQFIKLLGMVPANIHFPTGRCCNLDDPNPLTKCISDTVTRCECERMAQAGRFAVKFDPAKTCDDECPGCLANGDCNDNNSCTTDWCQDQACRHRALTRIPCDDGNLCTEDDGCVNGVCAGMPAVQCPQDQRCDPSDGLCKDCYADAHCDDGDACTTDRCDPATGCGHSAVDCDDDDACTTDTCDPASGCDRAAVDCNDNNACTMDACDSPTGCEYWSFSCDDADPCTMDTCDPNTGCVHTAVDCDDESACTDDRCVEGDCVHEPTYDDALYCCYPGDATLCGPPSDSPGDFDGDGDVDLTDVAEFQNCFGSAPITGSCNGVDLTCDCAVDASDVDDFVSALTGP